MPERSGDSVCGAAGFICVRQIVLSRFSPNQYIPIWNNRQRLFIIIPCYDGFMRNVRALGRAGVLAKSLLDSLFSR